MQWIVFDYGEVISRRSIEFPRLAETIGTAEKAFNAAYWAERERYCHGCSDLDYWSAVGIRLGIKVDSVLSNKLTAIDTEGWLHPNEDSVALVADLAATKTQLALLSNAPASFAPFLQQQPWTEHFRHVLVSGTLGVAKPYPEIWAALVDGLDAVAQDCLFIDDSQTNVDGARAAGLHAERWSTAEAMRQRLTELNILT